MFNSFSPDLQITVVEGKTFNPGSEKFNEIKNLEKVADFAEVLEDKALLRYNQKQTIATVKGVSENFEDISGVDSMIVAGTLFLPGRRKLYNHWPGYSIFSQCKYYC